MPRRITEVELTPGDDLPENLYWNGKIIYYTVSHNGDKDQGSTGTRNLRKAIEKRDEALFKLKSGTGTADKKNVKITELLDDYLADLKRKESLRGEYGTNHWRSTRYTVNKHVRPFFGPIRADRLTTNDLNTYWDRRVEEYRKEGVKEGDWVVSVSKELTYLRRALKLAMEATPKKLTSCPKFPMINNKALKMRRRMGFIEAKDYNKLMEALADHVKPILAFSTFAPVRAKEVSFIRRDQVDWVRRTVNLLEGQTKEGPGRTVGIPEVAFQIIRGWEERTQEIFPHCPYLFHWKGQRTKSWKRAWLTGCKKAGLAREKRNADGTLKLAASGPQRGKPIWEPLIKFHDTRRTAITLQGLANTTTEDSMKTAGHTTVDIHQGYDQAIALRVVTQVDKFTKGKGYGKEEQPARETVSNVISMPSPVPVAAPSFDFDRLRELSTMFEKGLLTKEEFDFAKKQLYVGVPNRTAS